jgi:hypothetical protein
VQPQAAAVAPASRYAAGEATGPSAAAPSTSRTIAGAERNRSHILPLELERDRQHYCDAVHERGWECSSTHTQTKRWHYARAQPHMGEPEVVPAAFNPPPRAVNSLQAPPGDLVNATQAFAGTSRQAVQHAATSFELERVFITSPAPTSGRNQQ